MYHFPESLAEALQVRENAYQRLDMIQDDDARFRTTPRDEASGPTDNFAIAFNDLTEYLVALNRHIRMLELKEQAKKYTQ